MRTFFSVIIPVCNKGACVGRTIESVLSQEFKNYELIIVIDPSVDESASVVSSYAGSNVRVVHRANPGPGGYAGRNLGARLAQGDHLAFLDADDEWTQCHLSEMAASIRQFPDQQIYCAGYKSTDRGRVTKNRFNQVNEKMDHLVLGLREMLEVYLDAGNRVIHTSTVVLHKERILKMGGFPEGRTHKGGDLFTWIRLAARGNIVWSAHTGAIVHHDAANRVSKTAYFSPLLFQELVRELAEVVCPSEIALLQQYVNYLLIKDVFRCKIKTGKTEYRLVDYVYPTGVKDRMKGWCVHLLPGSMMRTAGIAYELFRRA